MLRAYLRTYKVTLWQIAFIILGTTWLYAPLLNPNLSLHTTLISQFETFSQPYAWLFRLGDILAAGLFITVAIYGYKKTDNRLLQKRIFLFLIMVGGLMLIDPIITTTCQQVGQHCTETKSLSYFVHGAESILLAFLILGLSLYDSLRNRTLPSTLFLVFQVAYGALFISKLAEAHSFATLSQFIYQLICILWLAWFMAIQFKVSGHVSQKTERFVRRAFAIWAYINGFLAIILSLAHMHLFGFIKSVYFAGDGAWIAQHGVIVGVAMLYISRNLWRGEHRARVLFLCVLFMEIIKYAIITPNGWLLALYSLTFVALFASGRLFNRGSVRMRWQTRLQEASLVVAGVGLAVGFAVGVLALNSRHFEIARESVKQFGTFVVSSDAVPKHMMRSSLLAHTITALTAGTLFFVLWSLFRPVKEDISVEAGEPKRAERLLRKYSTSSEDYFKLWPLDKQYFWRPHSFVAYKITNSVVFALADPIAPNKKLQAEALKAFVDHWSSQGYRVCFLMVGEESRQMYKTIGLNLLQIGSGALITTKTFGEKTIHNKWWRWQNNRSTKQGYTYHQSTPPHSEALLRQIKDVSDQWLTRPGHQEQGFAMGSYSDEYMQNSRLHYLTDSSAHVVAFANEPPIFNNLKQTTVDLIRFIPSMQGAMPFLLAQLIAHINEEGAYQYFDLGFVPLAKMTGKLAGIAKVIGKRRYSVSGLIQFKSKFEPEWQKYYIAYDGGVADLAAIGLNTEEVMKAE